MTNSKDKKNTFGLALSGSGNRTAFYIGFLEELENRGLRPDYISACSGGSLVAAAYGAGRLGEMKDFMMDMDDAKVRSLITRVRLSSGGIYSSEKFYQEILRITQGMTFEESQIKMSFVSVDIESGELVTLNVGEMAKAAIISCTLPGLFAPVKWGNRTLVDGGLLVMLPTDILAEVGVDFTVGINMRGTRHIFTQKQLKAKKIFNYIKKITLVDTFESLVAYLLRPTQKERLGDPGFFTVLGKSMDLALAANSREAQITSCDLEIVPDIPKLKRGKMEKKTNLELYETGKWCASENIPKILELLNSKN